MFRKATKRQAKLRFTFDGPAGSGKTYSALVLAKQLGGRVALIDTEHGSASKYANLFEFDAADLDDHSIDSYIRAINVAATAKYDVLIIDSLSHAWSGKGGALEMVDRAGGASKFTSGWKTVTPLHNKLIDTLLGFPGHLICTMRTKVEWVLEKDEKGKSVPLKVGTAPVQRDGMEYEFDVVADIDVRGNITITKTRCPALSGAAALLTHNEVAELGGKLKAWLSDGVADVAPPPAPPAQPASSSAAPPAPPADFDVNSTPPPTAADRPPSPEESEQHLAKQLQAASSKADLERLVPALRQLPDAARGRLRPLWDRRLGEVTRKGGAHAVNG